jgi:uncharacterized damage-inducible protein DinB
MSTVEGEFKMTDLQYPIGKFQKKESISASERGAMINEISATPAKLRAAVKGLSAKQLATPYRPEGWTVSQLVHHIADSHANAYIRFKLGLTEDEPTIKPYNEKKWAELEDSLSTPIEVSLAMTDAVHHRWNSVMRAARAEDFARTLRHPEMGVMNLDALVQLYHWHGRHHVAHITSLRQRNGWN